MPNIGRHESLPPQLPPCSRRFRVWTSRGLAAGPRRPSKLCVHWSTARGQLPECDLDRFGSTATGNRGHVPLRIFRASVPYRSCRRALRRCLIQIDLTSTRIGTLHGWRAVLFCWAGAWSKSSSPRLTRCLKRGHAIVVNCAGVGARTLARDPLVRAMRGIVVHTRRTPGLVRSLHDDAPYNIVAYVFIYDDHLVLGSTYEADVWDEVIEEEEVQAIIEHCCRLAGIDGCPNWRDLGAEIIDRSV